MDFFKLDAQFQPLDLIEGYDTLIWTERYMAAGDFVLTTANIEETMAALPIDSLVTIKESRELMFVETHEIDQAQDGIPLLKVSGRSFETFFENRVTLRGRDPINDAAGEAIDIPIDNATSVAAILSIFSYCIGPFMNPLDVIPTSIWKVASAVTRPDKISDRAVDRGDAYSAILKILGEADLGIRNIRPTINVSNILTEIYHGDDRSTTVVLDIRADHFESTKHLWSNKGYKTAVYSASTRYFTDRQRSGTTNFAGLRRRVGLVDNSDITKAGTTYLNRTKTRGTQYLIANSLTTVFEGQVSPNIPYIYGKDYDLGDYVHCIGNYGVDQKLMVTEYVRTDDADGEQGYPSLSAIDDGFDD